MVKKTVTLQREKIRKVCVFEKKITKKKKVTKKCEKITKKNHQKR
jgi:hypothetical protein